MATNTMYVRVREAQQQFAKDLIDYPPDTEENRNVPPRRFKIHVQGYDELGRPVCPVYEVEECTEINDAISHDRRRDPRAQTDRGRDPSGFIIASRLVRVFNEDVKQFPMWVGHPNLDMSPEEAYVTVQKIRAEQSKGDRVLGLERPSKPYNIPEVSGDPNTRELRKLYENGRYKYYMEHDGELPETDTDPVDDILQRIERNRKRKVEKAEKETATV